MKINPINSKCWLVTAQKQVGVVYHFTYKAPLLKMLKSGKLAMSTGRALGAEEEHQRGKNFFASLTRSRRGGYHFRDGGKASAHGNTQVMITLDGNSLSNNHKIVPVDYWKRRGDIDPYAERSKEVEERLVSDKPEISILKHIIRVDFIQSGGEYHEHEDNNFGLSEKKVTLRKVENDDLADLLGSLIVLLKRNNITYGFYNSMADWAAKKGEYSYIGEKRIERDSKSGWKGHYLSDYAYKSLLALKEALSDKPYEKLSDDAQRLCSQLMSYPNDVAGVFNEYENSRKPDANPVARDLTIRIVNTMKRKGFSSKKEAAVFMASKATVWNQIENKKRVNARYNKLAPLYTEALTKHVSLWDSNPSGAAYESPIKLFSKMDSIVSYEAEDAKRLIMGILNSEGPAIDDFKSEAVKLGLSIDPRKASSIVSHILNENVRRRN